jgi:hypothetical protein
MITFSVTTTPSALSPVYSMKSSRSHRSLLEAYLDTVLFALLQGDVSSARPPLPFNVIHSIAVYLPLIKGFEDCVGQIAAISDGPLCEKTLNTVPPLKRAPAKLILQTRSRDQGWVSDPSLGNYSWFDVQIRKRNGEKISFRSHHNRMAWGKSFVQRVVFDQEHEIWSRIEIGDSLEIVACALFTGWANYVDQSKMSLFARYVPDFQWLGVPYDSDKTEMDEPFVV